MDQTEIFHRMLCHKLQPLVPIPIPFNNINKNLILQTPQTPHNAGFVSLHRLMKEFTLMGLYLMFPISSRNTSIKLL